MGNIPLVLITGIKGGIGAATSNLLSDTYRVAGFCRTEDESSVFCDLCDSEQIESAYSRFVSTFGSPKYLVNCAGVYHAKSWDKLSVAEFDNTYEVNVRAPFILSRLVADSLIKEGKHGVIVNVASVSGQVGSIDPAYAATKAGIIMLTKTMGKALAAHNVRVCGVAPGPVDDTNMANRIPDDRKKLYMDNIPMKRFATTEEVAKAIKFLLSDDASYTTGSVLNVDGGLV